MIYLFHFLKLRHYFYIRLGRDRLCSGIFNEQKNNINLSGILTIKDLYQPIQPTITDTAEQVRYREFLPDSRLQHYIHCYWQLQTTAELTAPFHYRVVADGCIDIYFELQNPEESYVIRFSKTYTEFPLDNTFNYIGVRFYPAMFPLLFSINAAELANRYELLALVLPDNATFLAQHFNEKLDLQAIKTLLDHYYLKHISTAAFQPDNRFFKAMTLILENSGTLAVEKDLDTGISSRQLRRLFEFYIGDSAKTFSKVVRFQSILKEKPSLRENPLFFDAGYYDQAHFIKEFKNMYGATPGNVLK
ncbi:AraC family transcriptional regulator [Flavobacterium inviolabile]|uniref:AraC family transcriptional regulator n=1 Tax=Flavobacterium inviolabile TaxID=2748320 RepID=UPI0015AB859E|nr:helix-turn-helix domain-containing protein [Flavobacterium inviolabile]